MGRAQSHTGLPVHDFCTLCTLHFKADLPGSAKDKNYLGEQSYLLTTESCLWQPFWLQAASHRLNIRAGAAEEKTHSVSKMLTFSFVNLSQNLKTSNLLYSYFYTRKRPLCLSTYLEWWEVFSSHAPILFIIIIIFLCVCVYVEGRGREVSTGKCELWYTCTDLASKLLCDLEAFG